MTLTTSTASFSSATFNLNIQFGGQPPQPPTSAGRVPRRPPSGLSPARFAWLHQDEDIEDGQFTELASHALVQR